MRCIYTKKTVEEGATFDTREHIFPAGIGGINKLPLGMVSDEANRIFSKLELKFMRDSIISLYRGFHGPGKRGSFSPKKQTNSKISVIKDENGKFALGYISLGKPYFIFNLVFNYNEVKENRGGQIKFNLSFSPDNLDYNKIFENLIHNLEIKKVISIINEELGSENYLLGIHESKLYIAHSNASNIDEFIDYLINEKFFKKMLEKINLKKLEINEVQPTMKLKFDWNIEEYFRVIAKICFNNLSCIYGADFVLSQSFDKIRNYILNGGNNEFVNIIEDISPRITNLIPEKTSHFFIITKIEEKIVGILKIYEVLHMVILCENFEREIFIDGTVCDWQNKIETPLRFHRHDI